MSRHDDGPENGDPGSERYFDLSDTEDTDGGASVIRFADLESYEIAAGLFFRPVFAENLSLNFVTFPPHSGFPPTCTLRSRWASCVKARWR